MFHFTDGTARILPQYLSFFTSPVTSIHTIARDDRHCVRESGVTLEDRSTIHFGCVWVQTPAACVPGQCFIHCAPAACVPGQCFIHCAMSLRPRVSNLLKLCLAERYVRLIATKVNYTIMVHDSKSEK